MVFVVCIVLVIDCPAFQALFFNFIQAVLFCCSVAKLCQTVCDLMDCSTSDLWLVWIDYLLLAHEPDIEGWPKINSSKSASMFSLPPTIHPFIHPFRHSPSWLTFPSASSSGTFPFVVSKLGFAQNSPYPFGFITVCRHFFMWHFSVLLPEGFPTDALSSRWPQGPLFCLWDLPSHFTAPE